MIHLIAKMKKRWGNRVVGIQEVNRLLVVKKIVSIMVMVEERGQKTKSKRLANFYWVSLT